MSFFLADTISDITTGGQEGQTYNYWAEFANMLMTLAFIIVLIIVTVWVLKKVMRSRVQNLNRSAGIKILERRPLNQKSSLYLVNILGKGVVISESQAGVQVITEFSEETNIEKLLEQLQAEQNSQVSFRESFTKKMKRLYSKNA